MLTEADLPPRLAGRIDRRSRAADTVVTPLAREQLRDCGVALTWRCRSRQQDGRDRMERRRRGQRCQGAVSIVRALAGEGAGRRT